MESFLSNLPEAYGASLWRAIEAINETKGMLAEVAERFGTTDPAALRARIGETCGGIRVDETAIAALETLLAIHEQRRAACLAVMQQAAKGEAAPPPCGVEP